MEETTSVFHSGQYGRLSIPIICIPNPFYQMTVPVSMCPSNLNMLLFHFWVVNPSRCFLCLYTSFFIFYDCCLLLSICVLISLCVVSVALALVLMPELYSTAYRATFPAFYAVTSNLFLLPVCFCLCFLFYREDVLCWLLSCPFSSLCSPCLFPISGLIWYGSVYLVTTAGFVADQLIRNKQQQLRRSRCIQIFSLNNANCLEYLKRLGYFKHIRSGAYQRCMLKL